MIRACRSVIRRAIDTLVKRTNAKNLLADGDRFSRFPPPFHHPSPITEEEDVERGKPNPQVFLIAAPKLDVSPNRCIVVEDALAGVEGARRAGMRSIGVRTGHGQLDADLVVDSLSDLPNDASDRLLNTPLPSRPHR